VDADGREVALLQQGVELRCPRNRLDEDANLRVSSLTCAMRLADLVELEVVEQVVELAVLLLLLELEEVLLQTVQGELGLVVDVDLEGLTSVHVSKADVPLTLCMNFLHVTRISLDRVAENIMTCLWCGVDRKISWTSRRMSGGGRVNGGLRQRKREQGR